MVSKKSSSNKGTRPVAADGEVPLSLIYTKPQVRKTFSKETLQELANSIKELGVIEPIVLSDEGARYRLVCGERRFQAAKLAGLRTIPAIVKSHLSELEIRQIQVAENNDRENLTPYDEAMGVSEDVEQFGFKEAQKIWNRSEAWISKRVAVRKYKTPTHALLKSGLCGDLEVLHSLNQLADLDEGEYRRMEKRLKDGLTLSREEARNKLASVKQHKKQEATFALRRAQAEESQTGHAAQLAAIKNRSSTAESRATLSKSHTASTHVSASADRAALDEVEQKRVTSLLKELKSSREALFHQGRLAREHLANIAQTSTELQLDMNETEFAVWSGFLSVMLPALSALGEERARAYLKRLQLQCKSDTPVELWNAQHPALNGADDDFYATRLIVPDMPEHWRF